jgi:anti-sigma factor RsiW
MSCRTVCRELLELFRFGELDRRSAPHLEHLAACRSCRDEVGFDRELVDRLRVALAQRIEHEGPSGAAFAAILARAQSSEPLGWRRWLHLNPGVLAERLRAASGVAVVGLAVLLSTGTQIDIVQAPDQSSGNERSSSVAAAAWSAGVRAGRGAQAANGDGNRTTASLATTRVNIPLAEYEIRIGVGSQDDEPEPQIVVSREPNYPKFGEPEPDESQAEPSQAKSTPPPPPVAQPS